jgi:hypothetical protein
MAHHSGLCNAGRRTGFGSYATTGQKPVGCEFGITMLKWIILTTSTVRVFEHRIALWVWAPLLKIEQMTRGLKNPKRCAHHYRDITSLNDAELSFNVVEKPFFHGGFYNIHLEYRPSG